MTRANSFLATHPKLTMLSISVASMVVGGIIVGNLDKVEDVIQSLFDPDFSDVKIDEIKTIPSAIIDQADEDLMDSWIRNIIKDGMHGGQSEELFEKLGRAADLMADRLPNIDGYSLFKRIMIAAESNGIDTDMLVNKDFVSLELLDDAVKKILPYVRESGLTAKELCLDIDGGYMVDECRELTEGMFRKDLPPGHYNVVFDSAKELLYSLSSKFSGRTL